MTERWPHLRRTLLRGPVTLVGAISVGLRAIHIALRESTGIEPTEGQVASTLIAVAFGMVGVFVAAPALVVAGLSDGAADVMEATLRAAVLVGYLAIVSRAESARRLFGFHGAEHKVIAAFEASTEITTIDSARSFSPIHPRCGTSFIALFVIVAGIVHAFVLRDPVWAGAGLRVVLIPFDAAVAYELMRAAARAGSAWWGRLLGLPGRLLQRITTREPTDDQLQVARAALEALLAD